MSIFRKPDYNSHNKSGELPLEFKEVTKNQGLIVSWCPKTKFLAHQAIACFLTHCGWNSILETISADVPVIAYSQWTDQPTNANLLSDVFNIGVRLRPNNGGGINGEEVGKCIGEIVNGTNSEGYKKNAMELKLTMREGGSCRWRLIRQEYSFVRR
ncbi:hypothetical protein LWI28_029053 [Acer negundo]|uniref:Uncharacterized protein n=1 Tax=Acer negundo TaxID=4023 RepID=A0AAD5J1Y4_ACENE|nr:hypothetical protein LWI28_029053 [Acer negundo]